MKRKKLVAVFLATVMAVSALTGCGEKETTANTETSETKQESTVATPEPEVPAEPAKLTIWSDFTGSPMVSHPSDTPYFQAIQEACNVEFEFIDSTGSKDAMSLLIGSNTLPDLVLCNEAIISGGVQSLLTAGAIVPLNELMDKGWMPNLKAYLESDADVDRLCKNEAGLYAWAPMIRAKDTYLSFGGYAVRKDWLDELNLEVPTTIEDMEKVLLAFKEKKGAETGLQFFSKNTGMLPLSWGVVEDFYLDGDTIKYGYIEDAYKDYLELANKWINLGILDPDTFSQDNNAYWAKVASGKSGMGYIFTGSGFSQIEKIKEEVQGMEYVAIAFPTLNKGEEFPVDNSDLRVANTGIFVSANCEDQEAAARVIDYIYSEEGTMLGNFGVEGESYEIKDGKAVFTEFVTNNPDGLSLANALALYAGQENKPYIATGEAQIQKYALSVQQDSVVLWDTKGADIKVKIPGNMTEEENEEYKEIMSDIKTYVSEYKLKFILGTESLDNYEVFRENLIKMGIERAIEIKQAAYDRFASK